MTEDHLKVDKAWLQKVVWGLIVALGSGALTVSGFFWTWEKSQITETQFKESMAVYDHGTVLPLGETTQPPREGMAKAVQSCQSAAILTQTDIGKVLKDNEVQKQLIIKQYEWLVRITAASSEPNALHRAQTGARAVAHYRASLKEGQDPDDAAASALETNPYQLR